MQNKYLSFFPLFCVTLYAAFTESKEMDGRRICFKKPCVLSGTNRCRCHGEETRRRKVDVCTSHPHSGLSTEPTRGADVLHHANAALGLRRLHVHGNKERSNRSIYGCSRSTRVSLCQQGRTTRKPRLTSVRGCRRGKRRGARETTLHAPSRRQVARSVEWDNGDRQAAVDHGAWSPAPAHARERPPRWACRCGTTSGHGEGEGERVHRDRLPARRCAHHCGPTTSTQQALPRRRRPPQALQWRRRRPRGRNPPEQRRRGTDDAGRQRKDTAPRRRPRGRNPGKPGDEKASG